jgi:hypothetical protein
VREALDKGIREKLLAAPVNVKAGSGAKAEADAKATAKAELASDQ